MQDISEEVMDKKKKIVGSVGFFSGLFILLAVLSSVVWMDGDVYNVIGVQSKIKHFSKLPENTMDVLIIGDSETYSAINPLQIWKEQGITSYLCGTQAQRLCDTYNVLKASLETQKPELIIFETNCMFRYAGIKPEMADKTLYELSQRFSVFKYHNRWKQLFSRINVVEYEELKLEHSRKGFKLRENIVPYTGGEWMKESDQRKDFAELAEGYMDKIYELCKEKNIEILLVTTPSPRNWSYEKHNSVSDWAKAKDLTYLDLNLYHKELQIDWSKDSRDGGDHMNFSGSKKITTYLSNYLNENYTLPDHRQEEIYSSWHEDLKNSGMEL